MSAMFFYPTNDSGYGYAIQNHRNVNCVKTQCACLPTIRTGFASCHHFEPCGPNRFGRIRQQQMLVPTVTAQIGGFLVLNSDVTYWFSERFTQPDFQSISIPVNANMQRDIVSYETLAQIAVVTLLSQHFPSCRSPVCIHSLSDNTGAEAGSNALFSTQLPQCLFLERLCLLASITGIDLDVSHIAGAKNDLADTLSRLTKFDNLPSGILPEHRIRFQLKQLWHSFRNASLHPPNAFISWSLPTGTCCIKSL